MKILVAGASGLVGYEVTELARSAGHEVRTLSRDARRAERLRALTSDVRLADATRSEELRGVCDGVDVVFSAMGASVGMQHPDKRGFFAVDLVANKNLLAEAKRAGVRRFVYVAVHVEPSYAKTRYVEAHEAFVAELANSGLAYAVVRPTGIFGALSELVTLAEKGVVPLIGGGAARTNPVHERDVAEACLRAIVSGESGVETHIGGPDVLTRREMAELAFEAVGKQPRFFGMPAFVMRLVAALIGLFDARRGEFFTFAAQVSVTDCVAQERGQIDLASFFRSFAKGARALHAPATAETELHKEARS